MRLLNYVKEDWTSRLPYHIHCNRYRGWSRPAFSFWCIVYYSIKSLILLCFLAIFLICKFVLWDVWNYVFKIDQRQWFLRITERFRTDTDWIDNGDEEYEYEEEDTEDEIIEEELPFCQLFSLGEELCLMIDHVELCPDETAFIRVVCEESYTPLYKRKVRRDKRDNRYIVFNGQNLYLEDAKTKPIIKP